MRKRFVDLLAEPLAGKVVLVRVDFNVPLDNGKVTDDTRIKSSLETIQALVGKGARVVLISHLNRPGGQVVEADRLTPIRDQLQLLMNASVKMLDTCVGPTVKSAINDLNNSDILMLENIRFCKEEESNDDQFAQELASYGDFFVQDAFGAVHRKHASTYGIPQHLPAYSGALLDKELAVLTQMLDAPDRPLMAIIGGAKISSKFAVLERLLERVDVMVLGGAMVYTLLLAQGASVGTSLVEVDLVPQATSFLEKARNLGKTVVLPRDHVVVSDFNQPSTAQIVTDIADGQMGVDIGPESIKEIQSFVSTSRSIFWNGPLGVFEISEYSNGTFGVANALANADHAVTIIGGGDSIAAINQAGLSGDMDHLSTGGGASLEFLEGKALPGINVLS